MPTTKTTIMVYDHRNTNDDDDDHYYYRTNGTKAKIEDTKYPEM
jgi:hypothetical protein